MTASFRLEIAGKRYQTPMGSPLPLSNLPGQQLMPGYEIQPVINDITTVKNINFHVMTTLYPTHLAHSLMNSASRYGH